MFKTGFFGIFALALVSACGTQTTQPPTTQPTASFISEATNQLNAVRAVGRQCKDSSQDLGFFAAAPAVSWSNTLYTAALSHSQDMQSKNFFSHTGSAGSSVANRISSTGYLWNAVGENIAAGQANITEAMNAWVASAGHCANLMDANFSEFALAKTDGTSSNTYDVYWTQDFARPK